MSLLMLMSMINASILAARHSEVRCDLRLRRSSGRLNAHGILQARRLQDLPGRSLHHGLLSEGAVESTYLVRVTVFGTRLNWLSWLRRTHACFL